MKLPARHHWSFTIRRSLIARFLPTFVILHSSSGILPAAPPPELTVLRTQYDKVVSERVTAPFEAALAGLNAKFTTALDNAAAEAKKAGNLPAVLAIEDDKKRIASKLPLLDDEEQTPDSLKKLRAIYREQFKRLDDQREANLQTILPAYTTKLQALETTLTKADRVDEAKEVMQYREGLAAAATKAPGRGPAAPAKESEPSADTAPKVSTEDAARQLVEWAVKNGHTAMVSGSKGPIRIAAAQDIPKEKFELLKIESVGEPHEPPPWRLFQFTPSVDRLYLNLWEKMVVGPDDMGMLRKLKQLKSLEFKGKVEDTRALVAAMPPLPALSELIVAVPLGAEELTVLADRYPQVTGLSFVPREGMTEADFAVLERFKHVARLRLDWLKEPLIAGKARSLARMPALTDLGFIFPAVAPLDAETAALLLKIKKAHIHYRTPPGAIEGLCALPSLTELFCRNFEAFVEDHLTAITTVPKLTSLNLDGISKLDDAALTRILAALPVLEELRIVNCAAITDVSLASLAGLKKLSKLTLGMNTALTADAILARCQGLKKLKDLSVKDTGVTDAALAAFKKSRADVKVVK